MRLYPPDLGGVRVSMTVNNGTVQATFVADRPETAQLLQQQTQNFREMMSRNGLTVDQVQVTVSASSASSGANSYSSGQSGNGQQDRQEALWNRQQQQQTPGRQQSGQQNAWDETGN
jgi:flagellar hook-length control protein FliK